MTQFETVTVDTDLLICGGGMAACGAAVEASYWAKKHGLKVTLVDKAAMDRSGAVAMGLSAINQYVDRDIDHVMVRTRRRPLPGGRMSPMQVLGFGIAISLVSFIQLWLTVNLLTALLALAGILFYVFIYTALLMLRNGISPNNTMYLIPKTQ